MWENYFSERGYCVLYSCPTCLPKAMQKDILTFNPLPDDKILDWSKLKALAYDKKKNVTKKLKFVLGMVENMRRRRKCWLPAFSPFFTMFSKGFFFRVVKSWDCRVNS